MKRLAKVVFEPLMTAQQHALYDSLRGPTTYIGQIGGTVKWGVGRGGMCGRDGSTELSVAWSAASARVFRFAPVAWAACCYFRWSGVAPCLI